MLLKKTPCRPGDGRELLTDRIESNLLLRLSIIQRAGDIGAVISELIIAISEHRSACNINSGSEVKTNQTVRNVDACS